MHIEQLDGLPVDILVASNHSRFPACGARDQVASHDRHMQAVAATAKGVRPHRAAFAEAALRRMACKPSDHHTAARLLKLWGRMNNVPSESRVIPYLLEVIAVQAASGIGFRLYLKHPRVGG